MIKLEKEFLVLINNEKEYNLIKLILYSYGIKEIHAKTFRHYTNINYYLRVLNKDIYQGSLKRNLDKHLKNIKQILTYEDIVNNL